VLFNGCGVALEVCLVASDPEAASWLLLAGGPAASGPSALVPGEARRAS
jgi:hypothetical protein